MALTSDEGLINSHCSHLEQCLLEVPRHLRTAVARLFSKWLQAKVLNHAQGNEAATREVSTEDLWTAVAKSLSADRTTSCSAPTSSLEGESYATEKDTLEDETASTVSSLPNKNCSTSEVVLLPTSGTSASVQDKLSSPVEHSRTPSPSVEFDETPTSEEMRQAIVHRYRTRSEVPRKTFRIRDS